MEVMDKVTAGIIGLIEQSCRVAYPDYDSTGEVADSLSLTDQVFGDLATSIAMRIAARLHTAPRTVADNIVASLPASALIREVSVAGAGYINFRLSDSALSTVSGDMSKSGIDDMVGNIGAGKTAAIDYSHPNIGKPMGVHHLLSTIIGDAIKRTMRTGGYTVIADNFIGDMGTQFGKLIWAVKQWGDSAAIESDPITELQKLYVKFHIESDGDVDLDDAARAEYLKLEQGDKENRELWHKIVGWSKAEIQPIYDALGVEFDYMHGESFYEDKMEPILERGIEEGVFTVSQGALVCVSANEDEPPAILRKSDGATLYLTRDLARIAYWEESWQPDIMLVVVDEAQSFAQRQLYSVARKLKLTDAQLTQVNFGRMRFADGNMSTRKGNILLLKDLLIEAEQRARTLVDEKSHGLSTHERESAAHILAISSIKYNILAQNRQSDIVFDWSNMLNFEGNSAPYLTYTLVRLRSLLSKAAQEQVGVVGGGTHEWTNPIERDLILQLGLYGITFERAMSEQKPSHLANYAYSLAQMYNRMYNNLPVIQAEGDTRVVRLQISTMVEHMLTHIFGCLGLVVPKRM